jgi:hypothetical protein
MAKEMSDDAAMQTPVMRASLLRPAAELGEIEARLDAVGDAAGDLRCRCMGWVGFP